MNENRQLALPIGRQTVRELELTGLAVRGLAVLNNTPAYLYLALHANPSRGDCVLQVEPFSYLSTPFEAQERLYIVDGEQVAPLDSNARAVVLWGETPRELNVCRLKRSVEYVLVQNGAVTPAGTSTGFRALDLNGLPVTPTAQPTATQYVLPGFAAHRTLYAALTTGTFNQATLEGQYGGAWHVLRDLTPAPAAGTLAADLGTLALPEQVRLSVKSSENTTLNAVVRFDI